LNATAGGERIILRITKKERRKEPLELASVLWLLASGLALSVGWRIWWGPQRAKVNALWLTGFDYHPTIH